jgi:hypothetical protein
MPMRRFRTVGVLLALTLAACTGPSPSATSSLGHPGTASANPSPAAAPGQPYDAAILLTAMRESTRPGGVPDGLESDAVAAAVADQLWTWDGQPWETLSVGGACGPAECSLEVAGSTDGTAGADLYAFAIDPATSEVALELSDLHAYPATLGEGLDDMARDAAGDELGDLTFVSARWLPPPDTGRYWLAYRSGGEEGASGLDLLLDAASGMVVERREVLGQP